MKQLLRTVFTLWGFAAILNTGVLLRVEAQPAKSNAPVTPPASVKQQVADSLLAPMPEPPKIEVGESYETIYSHQGPTIKINIPAADLKKVEKSWVKYLKNFKGKTKGTRGEFYTGSANINGVGEVVNIYSKIDGNDKGALLKLQADIGGGTYLSSKTDAAKFAVMQKIMLDFAISESVRAFNNVLLEEESRLLGLDNQRTDMKDAEAGIMEELTNLRAAMQRAEAQLTENKEAQKRLNYDIKKQINIIEYVKRALASVGQQK
ncbi:hypothetical protein C7N43_20015 [Sphingobacteriales bacterium UPWRP_1]|nr:hypothetical protein BVG80_02405 [Sphingobacteriales bacterium TSM_CSM]PSJ75209.1 hypothetical protein C7N43_20015 [Sphingobacteriales bacterium UPWRP_1]